MDTNLRPLSLGEILDRTAQLYRTNFLLFAGIAATYAAVALLVNLASVVFLEVFRTARFASPLSWQMQLFSWTSIILMLLVSNVAGAANNRAVAWVHLGEPATIAAAYRGILPDFWRYLGLGAMKLLLAWSPLMLLYWGFQASYIHFQARGVLPRPGVLPQPGTTPNADAAIFGLVSIVFFLIMWPVLVYCIFMALRYALALPASVVENLKVRAALKRSVLLTREARGRILVLWLLVMVLEFMVMAATQVFFVGYSLRHHYNVPLGLRIAQQIVGFFTNAFVGPILAIGTTLFYYDQRVRKEGFDIEWMMAAAGMANSGVPSDRSSLLGWSGAPPVEASVDAAGVRSADAPPAQEPPELHPAPDALSPGDGI
jgi:hypothetical protein